MFEPRVPATGKTTPTGSPLPPPPEFRIRYIVRTHFFSKPVQTLPLFTANPAAVPFCTAIMSSALTLGQVEGSGIHTHEEQGADRHELGERSGVGQGTSCPGPSMPETSNVNDTLQGRHPEKKRVGRSVSSPVLPSGPIHAMGISYVPLPRILVETYRAW